MVPEHRYTNPGEHLRGSDVPAAQIEFNYRHESLNGIVDFRDRQEHFGVAHEAVRGLLASMGQCSTAETVKETVGSYLVIRSSMLRGSKMKVGSTTLLKSAPGRSCDIMWDKTTPRSAFASL